MQQFHTRGQFSPFILCEIRAERLQPHKHMDFCKLGSYPKLEGVQGSQMAAVRQSSTPCSYAIGIKIGNKRDYSDTPLAVYSVFECTFAKCLLRVLTGDIIQRDGNELVDTMARKWQPVYPDYLGLRFPWFLSRS